jgi:uncharacterized membrane protein YoaT (DUF817 family)
MVSFAAQFLDFCKKQLHAALFAVFILASLTITQHVSFGLARYDLMLILCIGFQVAVVSAKLETKKELFATCCFHFLGICLEIYKVKNGSWRYPEDGLKIGGVPLFSGFMYASVASYLMQSWRLHRMTVERFPSWPWAIAIGLAVYANFFFARFLGDARWYLTAAILICFGRTFVHIDAAASRWRVNLLFGFIGLGFWVWVGENYATYLGVWQYPHQYDGWEWVEVSKLSSWSILVVLTFLIVAFLKRRSFDVEGGEPVSPPRQPVLDTSAGRRFG